jgi:hydroxyethylthiazole kinase-like uncharacterized protein yjeF
MAGELLTPAEMAQADRLAVAMGHPVADLMQAAGRAVARQVALRFRPCRTLVLCGPGNNGGDGYVAARLLAARGWPVAVAALAPPQGPAAEAARDWHGPTVPFAPAEAARAGLVIDAVFGAGLARALPDAVAATLAAARTIAAVDVPSGLDGATGQPLGPVAGAVLTVTFFRCKPGHLLLPGRELCGELVLADIGLPDAVLATLRPRTFRNGPALWRVPRPGAADHKYTRGHVTVLGGAAMTGAARLCADAARRAGAGLVTIAAAARADLYRAGAPGVLVDEAPVAAQLADGRRNVWVCGPGLGTQAAAAALPPLLASGRQVVVDADGLGACAGRPEALRGAAVLTPHAGEFARVFGSVGPDRLAACRAAAALTGAVVLLKGADTVIAAPDGRAAINADAPPWLATAGAGDVLAGIIGGLLAQGMPPWEAACAGAWLHGQAAVRAGPGLLAEELAGQLAAIVTETRGGGGAAAYYSAARLPAIEGLAAIESLGKKIGS